MKINIPEFLVENKLLKTIDTLSFAKYITYTPMTKSTIQMNSNALIYVTKGTKILHLSDTDKSINAGDIIFIKSGSYVMSEVLEESYEGLLFFYSDELLNDFIGKYEIDFKKSVEFEDNLFIIKENRPLQNGLLSIIPYFDSDTDINIVKLKFEEVFLNLVNSDDSFKSFLKSIKSDKKDFKSQIEKNYDNFESVKEFAKHFKMSELNFRNKFKEVFNTTPKKWILSKKLEKAKVLLEQSELNVSEVCQEVGFDNISWFIQSFKKEYGSTPKKQKLTKIQ